MEYLILVALAFVAIALFYLGHKISKVLKTPEVFNKLVEGLYNSASQTKTVNSETLSAIRLTQNYVNMMEDKVATIQKATLSIIEYTKLHAENSEKQTKAIEKNINKVFLFRMQNQTRIFLKMLEKLDTRTFNRSVQVFGDTLRGVFNDFKKENANHKNDITLAIKSLILDFLDSMNRMERAAELAKNEAAREIMDEERTRVNEVLDQIRANSSVEADANDEINAILSTGGIDDESIEQELEPLAEDEMLRLLEETTSISQGEKK